MAGILSQMRHCAVLGAICLQICAECREIPGKSHTAKRVKSCNKHSLHWDEALLTLSAGRTVKKSRRRPK